MCNRVTVENNNNKMISLKIYLVGTPFPLNMLYGNAVPMRSCPTTPIYTFINPLKLTDPNHDISNWFRFLYLGQKMTNFFAV